MLEVTRLACNVIMSPTASNVTTLNADLVYDMQVVMAELLGFSVNRHSGLPRPILRSESLQNFFQVQRRSQKTLMFQQTKLESSQ